MEINSEDVKTGAGIIAWFGTVAGFIWKGSKFHSRVEALERKMEEAVTKTDQRMCRLDVDNKLNDHTSTIDRLYQTQNKLIEKIDDLSTLIGDMNVKLAVIHSKVTVEKDNEEPPY